MSTQQKPRWYHHLNRMRAPGRRRAQDGKASTSLNPVLKLLRRRKGSVVIDIGCGDSGDRIVAAKRGFIGYGIDLYPPSIRNQQGFIQGNAVALPFTDQSVDAVVSHAMLSLLNPDERRKFYLEVARVLRPDGVFSLTITNLADGYVATIGGDEKMIMQGGLHRQRTGVYVRCRESCSQHGARRGFLALKESLRALDPNPDFLYTASIFLALFNNDNQIEETARFAGVGVPVVQAIQVAARREGIIDDDGNWHVEWPSLFANNDGEGGNIAFVLDVLALRGILHRNPVAPTLPGDEELLELPPL